MSEPLIEPAPVSPAETSDAAEDPSVFAQGVRYVLVGGTSAALELGIFWSLTNLAHVNVSIGNIIAVFIATVFNFLMNRAWTFNPSSNMLRSAVLYVLIWSINLTFTTTVITIAAAHGFNPTLVKVGTMGTVTLWNFYLFRKVVFA